MGLTRRHIARLRANIFDHRPASIRGTHAMLAYRGKAWMIIAILATAAIAPSSAIAENIRIGVVKGGGGTGPVYVGVERGYFAAEGIPAEIVFFEAAQPVAVATASGDIDFGVGGLSAGFYSLAAQGVLRIIAGSVHEFPGFHNLAFLASNRAYDSGLTSLRNLSGYSIAVPQIGSPSHYSLALAEEKYGIDPKSVRVLPLTSNSNMISAVTGGTADAGVILSTLTNASISRGEMKRIGYVGDETPWQLGGAYSSTKTVTNRPKIVEQFLRALKHGSRDWHDAFTGSDEKRRDGSTAAEIIAMMPKYTGEPVEQAALGIGYVDAEARLDVKDVVHQIAWYKSQGMLKGEVDADAVIDKRYVMPLPER
jgi:NitT/TauT family transport system substrate-binding protein